MIITLTEEEYNKIKFNEKEVYDRAYKDAYELIMKNEDAYLAALTQLLKEYAVFNRYPYANSYPYKFYEPTSEENALMREIRKLQEKYKL
jgi:hypothetical protein